MKTYKKTALILTGLLASAMSHATGTTAGTPIKNTATATYYSATDSGNQLTAKSDEVTVTVQEVIDASITTGDANTNVVSGQEKVAVLYTITNDGNGSEIYAVNATSTGTDFSFDAIKIYKDADGDGKFTATDLNAELTDNLINLAPDASVTLFIVTDIPAADENDVGSTSLTVVSQTDGASKASAGDVLEKVGDKGTDAIMVMDNGGTDSSHTYTVVTDPNASEPVLITKRVLSIVDEQYNTDMAVPGAVVTYQIIVQVRSSVDGLIVADPLPEEVSYVEGSAYVISSDQTDKDISTNNATTHLNDADVFIDNVNSNDRVSVDLGDQSVIPAVYTIQFSTTIN